MRYQVAKRKGGGVILHSTIEEEVCVSRTALLFIEEHI